MRLERELLKDIVVKNVSNKNKSLEHSKQREITRPFYRLEYSETPTRYKCEDVAVRQSVRPVFSAKLTSMEIFMLWILQLTCVSFMRAISCKVRENK